MKPAAKKYNTQYKKKVDVERDMYLPRSAPRETMQCSGCGAFYHRRHWTLVPPGNFSAQPPRRRTLCPACAKIRDHYPGGEVRLAGIDSLERGEIARILRNEEERARAKNPLERIMRLEASRDGWRVETTTEKLAQRLGRAVHKARGGSVEYKWSHNNKFVRVIWQKDAA